jgi:hypothetical protein
MSEYPWMTPEAVASIQKDWDLAIQQAKVTLAVACEPGGVLEQMQSLPHALNGALRDHLGEAHYRSLIDLVCSTSMIGALVKKGER